MYSFDDLDTDDNRLVHLTKNRPKRVRNKKPTVFNASSSLNNLDELIEEKVPSVVLRKNNNNSGAATSTSEFNAFKFRHTYQPASVFNRLPTAAVAQTKKELKSVEQKPFSEVEKPMSAFSIQLKPVNRIIDKENKQQQEQSEQQSVIFRLPNKQASAESDKRKTEIQYGDKFRKTTFDEKLGQSTTKAINNEPILTSSQPFILHNNNVNTWKQLWIPPKSNTVQFSVPVKQQQQQQQEISQAKDTVDTRFTNNNNSNSEAIQKRQTVNFNEPVQLRLNSSTTTTSTTDFDRFKQRKTIVPNNETPSVTALKSNFMSKTEGNIFSSVNLRPVNNGLKQQESTAATPHLRPVNNKQLDTSIEQQTNNSNQWQAKSIKDRIRMLSSEAMQPTPNTTEPVVLYSTKTCPDCKTEYERVKTSCPVCASRKTSVKIEVSTATKTCPSCSIECDKRLNFCTLCNFQFTREYSSGDRKVFSSNSHLFHF